MGPSLPPVPASDERQENQVENYFKAWMQDINIFEEMAIKVFHREWERETHPVCSPSHFVGLYYYRKTLPFSLLWKIWTSSQNKEKNLCYLIFPHTFLPLLKTTINPSANSIQILLSWKTFEIRTPTDRIQHKRQHFYHSSSLKATTSVQF